MTPAVKPSVCTLRLLLAAVIASPAWADPYVDRLIDPARLPAQQEERQDRFDASGLPRAFLLETTGGFTDLGDSRQEEYGIAGSAFWDSALWGAFSIDGGVHRSGLDGNLNTFGAVWQRGLNLPGGWQADNGVGVLNAPAPELQRMQARFFIPVSPMFGAASEVRRDGLQVQAGIGTPGTFTAGRLSGFESGEGATLALAANWRLGAGWQAAASMISTQGRDDEEFVFGGRARDGDSLFGAAAWTGPDTRAQVNFVTTRNGDGPSEIGNAPSRSSSGGWIDASTQAGWFRHDYGAYYLQPDLNWGGQWMNNDASGGYYRISHQRMRWNWSASLDHLSPTSGDYADSSFASGTVRYQASTRLGIGGSATARRAGTDAWLLTLFADQRNRAGITRYQLNLADNDNGDSAWQADLNQSFPSAVGRRISLTASYGERARRDETTSRVTSVALFGSQELLARLSLDGSVRASSTSGENPQEGYAANIGLNWQLSPYWRLLATYDRSSTTVRNDFVLEPFPGPVPEKIDIGAEAFFVTLRYSHRAGRPGAVLGGAPGGPAGFIQGSVFLDENGNGSRDAGEAGAANITVVLDNRFSVRTDSQGNFAFPMVAIGNYVIRVVTDNLPLPWRFDDADAEQQLEVGMRQQLRIDFPARR
jgi:hypothetical protein